MNNDFLSPHFELREFTESSTARWYGIVNEPPAEAVENLRALCVNTLEPLREALGLPIIITSGYRCRALNDKIGHHSDRSQHISGCAADFVVQGSKIKVQSGQSPSSKIKVQSGQSPSSKIKDQSLKPRELLIRAFRTIITNPAVDYDQLIVYPSFIHVSYVSSGKNRRKITKGYGNGKYCALTREEALELI